METDNHIKTPAERTQHPERPMLLSLKNVRRSHAVTILKPTRRLRLDMSMHDTETAAGNNPGAGDVRGHWFIEWIVKSLGKAACGIMRGGGMTNSQ